MQVVPSTHGLGRALRNGFAWWLPLVTAALGALIAVLLTQSAAAAWDADVHLWAREGRTPTEYASLVLDRSVQEAAADGMMASRDGQPQIDGVAVELNDTLIRVTVRSPQAQDAESLALSLAHAAIDEAQRRFGDEAGLDLLGLVQPGARKVEPSTNWSAAWASVAGLLVGLALAAATARVASQPRTTLGRLGRLGLLPVAVITDEAERDAGRHAPAAAAARDPGGEAESLADAIGVVSGIIALVPLDEDSGVSATLIQSARTLAARGGSVIWLDGRRPAFELEYGAPPLWFVGTDWSPVTRSALILRAASRAMQPKRLDPARAGVHVLALTDPLPDASALEVARAAAGVILLTRVHASDDELRAAIAALGPARLLGIALTQATAADLREFELAQITDE